MASTQLDLGAQHDVSMPVMSSWPDTYLTWCENEKSIPYISTSPPELHHRHKLVTWIKTASATYRFSYKTCHLALMLLDGFMTKSSIHSDYHHLLSSCCLVIAGMFDTYYY